MSLLKTPIFEKKCNLSKQKIFLTIFPRTVEHGKPQGTFLRVEKYPGKYCGSNKVKFLGPMSLLKTQTFF